MINFDKFLLGYVVFEIKESDVCTVINRLIKLGINQKIDKKGIIKVPYRLRKRYIEILSDIDYRVSDVKGVLGAFLSLRKRWGAVAAGALSAVMLFFAVNTVWDVRVEGCSDELANEVSRELTSAGVDVGALWLSIDKREIENRILRTSDDVCWISINRRGMVAYVNVIEKNIHTLPDKPSGYASIVADRDCVIEEITVTEGYPAVKAGDTVRRGEVLISGVLPDELGGGFCYAKGSVKGRYSLEITAQSQKESVERVYIDNRLFSVRIKIFGFGINIFKNYGKMPTTYDIISKNKEFKFLGRPIPLSVEYEIAAEYRDNVKVLDYADMAISATDELRRMLTEDFISEDLLSIKTETQAKENGYSIIARLVLRGEVAEIKEFEYKSE